MSGFVTLIILFFVIKGLVGKENKKNTTYQSQNRYSANRTTVDFGSYQRPSTVSRTSNPGTVNARTQATPAQKSGAGGKSEQKKPHEKGAVTLLVLALVFLFIGVVYLFDFLDLPTISSLLNTLAFGACSGASFFARHQIKKRAARLAKYLAVMGKDDCKSTSEIAKATGLAKDKVRKDLEYLAQRGDFGPEAYFDIGLDSLVISEEAAEKERQIRQKDKTARQTKADREANTTEYMRIFEEVREAASQVQDKEISEKMLRLTELTGKILQAAEANPEKEKDIRRFMSYYLPQTQKLMRSYATLEKQGVATANITATKTRIGDILDNLITGYEQQLDKLFDSDALDISSDIDVLETMLKQDGLTQDAGGLTLGGH